jgi:5'-3' exonuclease
MAQLVDFSQIFIGSYMTASKFTSVDMDVIRPAVLNVLRLYRIKFLNEFGELILCCDDRKSWRKELFPNYKASRKKTRSAAPIDWENLYECLNQLKEELTEWFPYKVIQVDKAEADDVIAVLVGLANERTLILSSDKDFIQLHHFNVRQYSPIQKKFVEGDAKWSLHEKLIKGDVGDGVPNIMSDDNVFVDEGRRQKPITKKKVDAWYDLDPDMYCDAEMLRNYNRNKQLIDLGEVPESIRINITNIFENTQSGDRKRLLTYFINHRLKNLTESLSEF